MTNYYIHIPWFQRDPSGLNAHLDDLGTVEIYRDKEGGWAVDINGQRAWSQVRGDLEEVIWFVTEKIRAWLYIGKFTFTKT